MTVRFIQGDLANLTHSVTRKNKSNIIIIWTNVQSNLGPNCLHRLSNEKKNQQNSLIRYIGHSLAFAIHAYFISRSRAIKDGSDLSSNCLQIFLEDHKGQNPRIIDCSLDAFAAPDQDLNCLPNYQQQTKADRVKPMNVLL